MQKYKIFSVYDSKVEVYSSPYFFRSRGEFLRSFQEAVNDSRSSINKHPGDFTAFEIGSWSDDTCSFEIYSAPISLGVAVEYVKSDVVHSKALDATGA